MSREPRRRDAKVKLKDAPENAAQTFLNGILKNEVFLTRLI